LRLSDNHGIQAGGNSKKMHNGFQSLVGIHITCQIGCRRIPEVLVQEKPHLPERFIPALTCEKKFNAVACGKIIELIHMVEMWQ
jgi:hypothetical protein